DGTGDNRFSQARIRVDDSLVTTTGKGIGRKEDACHRSVHHVFYHDRQTYGKRVDMVTRAITDRAIRPQGSPAAPHRVEHCFDPYNVEVGFLLTGEAREREVFGSSGGAHSHGKRLTVGFPNSFYDGCRNGDR